MVFSVQQKWFIGSQADGVSIIPMINAHCLDSSSPIGSPTQNIFDIVAVPVPRDARCNMRTTEDGRTLLYLDGEDIDVLASGMRYVRYKLSSLATR